MLLPPDPLNSSSPDWSPTRHLSHKHVCPSFTSTTATRINPAKHNDYIVSSIMLCKFCANIDLDELSTPEGYKHHASCTDLYQSSQNGCDSCKLIWDSQWEQVGGTLSATELDSGVASSQIIARAVNQTRGDIKRIRYGQEAMHEEYGSRWSIISDDWERPSEVAYLWCFLTVVARPGSSLREL